MTRAAAEQLTSGQVLFAPAPRFLARRTFSGRPEQVGAARRWLARLLEGIAEAGDAVLACSELAANAITHSRSGLPGGAFTVRVAIDGDAIRIEVADQGGAWSGARKGPGDEGDEAGQSGRGLTIVTAVARSWGTTGDELGRTVWCEIGVE